NALAYLRVSFEIIISGEFVPAGHRGSVIGICCLNPVFDAVGQDRFVIHNDRAERWRNAVNGQTILIILRWSHDGGVVFGYISSLGSIGGTGYSKGCTTKRNHC